MNYIICKVKIKNKKPITSPITIHFVASQMTLPKFNGKYEFT